MNRRGMGWETILSITILIAIIVITFGILTNTYAGWKLVKDDCKGTCRISTTCEVGETKMSETCYKAGKKQDGICCLSLDDLQNKNSSNSTNSASNSNSNGNSNSNSNGNSNGASNSGGTTTTGQGTPIIEIRKGQDDVTKILGGTTQTLTAGQTYNYRVWAAQQDHLYCTIKMLNSSNSELTQVQGMSLQMIDAPCSDAANSNSKQQQIALTPQFISGDQNVYKMTVVVHNLTGGTVASTSVNFLVQQTS
ncbi:hypothetical protein COV13_02435 [Candidatus Woesearchaeota archaeon CG10_big_fil_rev_8_21_14_0_10_32_9]|nr:MAG: hypothetical protein COV13_02435 [Candidatus Woesearchaeota archaeon CG10_big_fil_rev_8_21_14_0_10_32_9]